MEACPSTTLLRVRDLQDGIRPSLCSRPFPLHILGRADEPFALQFGNCLTAPYIPTFLLLLLYTPPTTFLISCPVYLPLLRRAHLAYVSSCSIPRIQGGWYAKWWSWIIVGGPIGRIAGGTILAWREMDRREREQGVDSGLRLGLGVVIALGAVLAMITGVSRVKCLLLSIT